MKNIKDIIIGEPLRNEELHGEKYTVFWGLPILASDPISSVAYASEEILLVLLPALFGIASFYYLGMLSFAIIGLLTILIFSYLQTIQNYPNGGGSYIVAKDNLGVIPGVTAGAALSVDYVLTVAVSISSGVAAIISAFPSLEKVRVEICLIVLLIVMIGNLRGLRESARAFSFPTYAFVLGIICMVVFGVYKIVFGGYIPSSASNIRTDVIEPVTILLLLRAFSSGCSALTGVEAVSNAVPNFKEPSVKRAKHTLVLLGIIVFICFGGTSLLASLYQIVPDTDIPVKTVLSQIANEVFGTSYMYYYVQITTALILILAANTAYSGFPLLLSVMARDGYMSRQFTQRGNRLSYSNGITVLTLVAAILIIVFRGDTHLLIPLYAVGVFLSFTLSQFGMLMKWIRHKEAKGRVLKAFINGLGALVTGTSVAIIGVTKFTHGAWIVIIVIPILVMLTLFIKRHYTSVALQLRIEDEELSGISISPTSYDNHVIVPIASLNKASIRALRYARTISDKVVAFNVSVDEESATRLLHRWSLLNTDIKLIIKYSPYRKVIEPLLDFIENYEEHEYQKGDIITIVLPQFSIAHWWEFFLHNQTRVFVENKLLRHKHVVVATMPLQLKRSSIVLDK